MGAGNSDFNAKDLLFQLLDGVNESLGAGLCASHRRLHRSRTSRPVLMRTQTTAERKKNSIGLSPYQVQPYYHSCQQRQHERKDSIDVCRIAHMSPIEKGRVDNPAYCKPSRGRGNDSRCPPRAQAPDSTVGDTERWGTHQMGNLRCVWPRCNYRTLHFHTEKCRVPGVRGARRLRHHWPGSGRHPATECHRTQT